MSFGGLMLRWAIVASWLVLLGWHIIHVYVPDIGLTHTFDPATAITANLDKSFRYDVYRASTQPPDNPTKALAHCTLTLAQEDARYRSTTDIAVANINDIQPGLGALVTTLLGKKYSASHSANASVAHILDARFRLIALEVSGSVLGMSFSGNGTVDQQGLHGRYRLGSKAWIPIDTPAITPDVTNSADFALNLPPHLVVGDTFSSRMLHCDPLNMSARPAVGVFTVQENEVITVAFQSIPCVRVALTVDNRPTAVMWADQVGVVYRVAHQGTGMTMELTAIHELTGARLWPPTTQKTPP